MDRCTGGNLGGDEFAKGDILEGPYWDEPVEVIAVDSLGGATEVHAVGTESQRNYEKVLPPEKLSDVEVRKKEEEPAFSGAAAEFRQAIESARITYASEYDPHHALSTSKVDPVPHQLEAVYKYMLPLNRIRFFLADDAGAGKTIMAGLLLKELKQRGIVDNCLILTPASLQEQWQKELARLFDEEFRIIRRAHIDTTYGNAWEENRYCISSMAFSIQEDVKDSFKETHWDLVIVDEAHHLAAYRRGAEDKPEKTERYKVGEILRENSIHTLFLSATPHKGDPDNFQLLLRLLDEDLFAEDQLPEEIIHSDQPGTIFLRRMKEDMMDIYGERLFQDRDVHTVSYEIRGEELEFYNAVTKYVEEQFQSAWKQDNRNVIFALIVLQRRVASSIAAAKSSLERRREGLQELYEDVEQLREVQETQEAPSVQELEEMAERQRWEIEEDALRRLTNHTERKELEKEIRTLERLVEKAEKLAAKGTERKLEELRDLLQGEREDTPFFQDEKLLIFTEARPTLDLLVDNLESWGYEVATIHGGMDMGDTKDPDEGTRLWAQDQFNDPDGPQVLVATEAAGEGINLHEECRLMVNYDLPWNPTLVEQRMGRIHRYGQDLPVHIYNMVASNTREGHVLETLSYKLEQMKQDIGSDRVFDVISELAEEVSLNELIRDVVSGAKDEDDARQRLQTIDEQAEDAVHRATERGLATRHIDLAQVQKWLRQDKEKRLSPEYIEKFFVTSFQLLGGTIERRQDGLWRIEWVPARFRDDPVQGPGEVPDTSYTKFTFYKEEADATEGVEFVAPGHPLFDAVLSVAREVFRASLGEGSLFVDPDAEDPYMIWFIQQTLENGNAETVGERIFAVRYQHGSGFERVNEGILHDLPSADYELGEQEIEAARDLYVRRDKALDWFFSNVVTDYSDEVEEEQREIVETVRPSMKQALNTAISSLNQDISDLKDRKEAGEQVDLSLENKKKKREELVQRRDRQLKRLEQSKHVSPTAPRVLGAALVLPPSEEDREEYGGMARDDDVEQAAMDVVMDHERDQGRSPEDVSEENLGFDVRSLMEEDGRITEARYIEVKGRAARGAVTLTENEWTMAQRLEEEFWLYVVTNATDSPELHLIRDPASKLSPDRRKVVRYVVPIDEWESQTGEEST